MRHKFLSVFSAIVSLMLLVLSCQVAFAVTDDHGNSFTSATELKSPGSVAFTCTDANDIDMFKYTAVATGIMRIYTSGAKDTKGILYDLNKKVILSNDDFDDDFNFNIYYCMRKGETYYISVNTFDYVKPDSGRLYVIFASPSQYGNLKHAYMYRANDANVIVDPYHYNTGGYSEIHYGIDIISSKGGGKIEGYPIYSVSEGKVLYANHSETAGYFVVIRNNDGTTSRYLHMQSALQVKFDDVVTRRTVLGYTSSIGKSSGPHLHYDINGINAISGGTGSNYINYTTTYNPVLFFPNQVFV